MVGLSSTAREGKCFVKKTTRKQIFYKCWYIKASDATGFGHAEGKRGVLAAGM